MHSYLTFSSCTEIKIFTKTNYYFVEILRNTNNVFWHHCVVKSAFAPQTLAAVGCLRPNDDRLPTSPAAGHKHKLLN